MDWSMNNGYVPSMHGWRGAPAPVLYQNPNMEWCPQIPEYQIPHGPRMNVGQQLGPYGYWSPSTTRTPNNPIHFPAPFVPIPQQEPRSQPGFYFTQPILPQTFPNVPYLPPTPPVQPYLTPESVMYSAYEQQPFNGSRAPSSNVNIEIPGGEYTPPYTVSIPVPINEFIPITSRPTSSQMALPRLPCVPSLVSLLKQTQFTGEGLGWRKKPQVRPTRSNREDSGSSRGNQREGETGLHLLDPCKLCQKNKETKSFCNSHTLCDKNGKVTCPILRSHVCKLCGATGDDAHTFKYCPLRFQIRKRHGGEPTNRNESGNGRRVENPLNKKKFNTNQTSL